MQEDITEPILNTTTETEETSASDSAHTHFTYCAHMSRDSLCQGDVLKPTPELREILREVHPYFLREQYRYFMVLTQSCDLVRRKGSCKSPYITLAAVRSYDEYIKRTFISGGYVDTIKGLLLLDDKRKQRAYELVERLYNNTEPGHFFLYKDPSLGLEESMVAVLKVSIALKSVEHYDTCLQAKVLELDEAFKAKLGWLVGDMYSRVGTVDWENVEGINRSEMLERELTSRCVIGTRRQIKALKVALSEKEAQSIQSISQAMEYIADVQIQTSYDELIVELEKIIQSSGTKIPQDEKAKLIRTIRSRHTIKSLMGL